MQIQNMLENDLKERIKWKVKDYNYNVENFLKILTKSKFQYLEKTKSGKWKMVLKSRVTPNYGKPECRCCFNCLQENGMHNHHVEFHLRYE